MKSIFSHPVNDQKTQKRLLQFLKSSEILSNVLETLMNDVKIVYNAAEDQ